MPELDLGDKPDTYLKNRQESEQIYAVPKSEYPSRIILRYQDWKPIF